MAAHFDPDSPEYEKLRDMLDWSDCHRTQLEEDVALLSATLRDLWEWSTAPGRSRKPVPDGLGARVLAALEVPDDVAHRQIGCAEIADVTRLPAALVSIARLLETGIYDRANQDYTFERQRVREMKELAGTVLDPENDAICEHGTALDMHCCNCHSGFIFDMDHACPPPRRDHSRVYPDPTAEDLASPEFEAIWQAIKQWDISRAKGAGYGEATGNDVMHILTALRGAGRRGAAGL